MISLTACSSELRFTATDMQTADRIRTVSGFLQKNSGAEAPLSAGTVRAAEK